MGWRCRESVHNPTGRQKPDRTLFQRTGGRFLKREPMRVNTGDKEQKIRMGIGAAAAAAAIFAPLRYKWKGVLTAVAAASLITGTTGYSPIKHLVRR
jgi:hypothetical protein